MPRPLIALATVLPMLAAALPAQAAGVDPFGSPVFLYELGELHADEYDFHPYAPRSYMGPASEVWGRSALQIGGTVFAVANTGRTIQGLPVFQRVGAENGGRTFWASAEAPWEPRRDVRGGYAQMRVEQTYIKRGDDAKLRFTYNQADLSLLNYGGSRLAALGARAEMDVQLFSLNSGIPLEQWRDVQSARFELDYLDPGIGSDDRWRLTTGRNEFISTATYPEWAWGCTCTGAAYGEGKAYLEAQAYTQEVDLSSIDVGQEFMVSFVVFTAAWDYVLGETAAYAYLQDPVSTSGGVGFEIEGLEATNRAGQFLTPVPEPGTWALWGLGLGLLGLAARRRTGDGVPAIGVRQRTPRWMR
jgi:hypothetical protein